MNNERKNQIDALLARLRPIVTELERLVEAEQADSAPGPSRVRALADAFDDIEDGLVHLEAAVFGVGDTARPDGCTDAMLKFLDELRESGVTNMFGAGPYLSREYGLSKNKAREVLSYWMQTFGHEER